MLKKSASINWKAQAKVEAQMKEIRSSLNLDLSLSRAGAPVGVFSLGLDCNGVWPGSPVVVEAGIVHSVFGVLLLVVLVEMKR